MGITGIQTAFKAAEIYLIYKKNIEREQAQNQKLCNSNTERMRRTWQRRLKRYVQMERENHLCLMRILISDTPSESGTQ